MPHTPYTLTISPRLKYIFPESKMYIRNPILSYLNQGAAAAFFVNGKQVAKPP